MPPEFRGTFFGVDRQAQHRNRLAAIKRISAEIRDIEALDGSDARLPQLLSDLKMLCTIEELERTDG